jgi:hypothetical protein
VHDRPLLEIGECGTFDDCGTVGTFAVRVDGKVYLYYNGYNVRTTVPWSNAIGLAVSDDGGTTFERMFQGAIADRTSREPFFAITPWIMREAKTWHIWYTSGTGWKSVDGKQEPLYVIKYARSEDGINWKRNGTTCIHPLGPEEANARAAVLKDEGVYRMWFCYRGSTDFRDGTNSYRIGYAEAQNPVEWKRDDARAGIDVGPDEWDSKMLAYPSVVDIKEGRYLFYNGNGFGVNGFGCAVAERDDVG